MAQPVKKREPNTAPMIGPTQYTHWCFHLPKATAGPNARAGLMAQPVKKPMVSASVVIVRPIANGAQWFAPAPTATPTRQYQKKQQSQQQNPLKKSKRLQIQLQLQRLRQQTSWMISQLRQLKFKG